MNLRLLKKLIDNTAIDCRTIGGFFGIDGKKLQRHIKNTSVRLLHGSLENMHTNIIYPKTWELIYLLMK
jgi:hypothetical protein